MPKKGLTTARVGVQWLRSLIQKRYYSHLAVGIGLRLALSKKDVPVKLAVSSRPVFTGVSYAFG